MQAVMAKIEVKMPKMGESITEGTVIVWYKKPGEAIDLDETLLEIGTDKVDTEVPSPAKGVLHEILVPEGETVDVGVTIAILDTEAEALVEAETPSSPPTQQPEQADPAVAPMAPSVQATTPQPAPEVNHSDSVEKTVVVMPKMGESITEGTVIVWHKQPGDRIRLDETLLEIGTDKVDTEVPSPAEGVLLEILVPEGETVDVGAEIAVIGSGMPASGAKAPATPTPAVSVSPQSTPQPPATIPAGDGAIGRSEVAEQAEIPRRGPEGQFFSPLVRSIAEKEGVSLHELSTIQGSGREGRITKADLLTHIQMRKKSGGTAVPSTKASPTAAPSRPPAPSFTHEEGRVEIVEMDRMRQIIAEHMVRSKATSPHVTSFAEVDVTNLVRVRERNKEAFQAREGIKLSYTPFMVHSAVKALREHPIVNASVDDTKIIIKKDYHIGIAVAIDQSRLVVPVIRNAGQLNLAGIAHAASDLAERARNKRLQPDDLQGGTFTVTNIGSIGSLMGTPIINQPQVAILATGAIKKKPVVIEDPSLGDIIAIRHMMFISLSYDHRIIDGAMAASFLQYFVGTLEAYQPDTVV